MKRRPATGNNRAAPQQVPISEHARIPRRPRPGRRAAAGAPLLWRTLFFFARERLTKVLGTDSGAAVAGGLGGGALVAVLWYALSLGGSTGAPLAANAVAAVQQPSGVAQHEPPATPAPFPTAGTPSESAPVGESSPAATPVPVGASEQAGIALSVNGPEPTPEPTSPATPGAEPTSPAPSPTAAPATPPPSSTEPSPTATPSPADTPSPTPQPTPSATPEPTAPSPNACADGIDNDGDGLIDLLDPGCLLGMRDDERLL